MPSAFAPGRGSRSASGWLEPLSSAAASAGPRASERPKATTSVTCGLPAVSVPVLSKATAVILPRRLQHRAALHQQAPPRAGREAGGDRRRRRDDQRAGAADQQDRQALVDPLAPGAAEQTAAARTATSARDRRARRRVVAREAVDEALGRRLRFLRLLDQPDDAGDGVVGGRGRDAHAQRRSPLIVPAKTGSPAPLRFGVLSPVTGASSMALSPSRITPSAGMRSPGRTRMIVADREALGRRLRRVRAVRFEQARSSAPGSSSAWMLARARPAATPSSSSPTRNRKTTVAASSRGADDHRADGGDRHQHLDRERRAGEGRHERAPRDRHEADQHRGQESPALGRRKQMADAIGGEQALPHKPASAPRGGGATTPAPARRGCGDVDQPARPLWRFVGRRHGPLIVAFVIMVGMVMRPGLRPIGPGLRLDDAVTQPRHLPQHLVVVERTAMADRHAGAGHRNRDIRDTVETAHRRVDPCRAGGAIHAADLEPCLP